jgi:hypothetical protein
LVSRITILLNFVVVDVAPPLLAGGVVTAADVAYM